MKPLEVQRGRPKDGGGPQVRQRHFTLDDETDALISRLASNLPGRLENNRSELVRRAVISYVQDGRSHLIAEFQATIAGLEAERENLRATIRTLSGIQSSLDKYGEVQRRLTDPTWKAPVDGRVPCSTCHRHLMPEMFDASKRCPTCQIENRVPHGELAAGSAATASTERRISEGVVASDRP